MWTTVAISWSLVLMHVSIVSCQSDSLCPANSAMGLCTDVPKPCFDDNDCFNGDICCPEACSRSCKPRNSGRGLEESAVPDLLNDPRVYVGKCPDATCYSMFGSDPNECSTSQLCPKGQFCCNDGCKNVCQWKPEYAAMIAQEKARARQQQQLLVQKQQEQMRRRQQEMYQEQRRQMAAAEQARKQKEARAAAEAELAVQQARTKFEADVKAAAAAQVRKSQTTSQRPQNLLAQASGSSAGSFLDNFKEAPNELTSSKSNNILAPVDLQLRPQLQQTAPTAMSDATNKKNNLPLNQINSPASFNPYSLFSQQSLQNKAVQDELMSLIQPGPSTSNQATLFDALAQDRQPRPSNLPQITDYQPRQQHSSAASAPFTFQSSNSIQNQSPTYPQIPSTSLIQQPGSQAPSAASYQTRPQARQYPPQNPQTNQYSAQNALSQYQTQNFQNQRSPALNPYGYAGQYPSPAGQVAPQRNEQMNPFLMYQLMQTAV